MGDLAGKAVAHICKKKTAACTHTHSLPHKQVRQHTFEQTCGALCIGVMLAWIRSRKHETRRAHHEYWAEDRPLDVAAIHIDRHAHVTDKIHDRLTGPTAHLLIHFYTLLWQWHNPNFSCLCVSVRLCVSVAMAGLRLASTVTPPWLLLHCLSWIPKMGAIWLH